MKNKGLVLIIVSLIIFIIVSILYFFSLKKTYVNLENKKWYHYNNNNGYFEIIELKNNTIIYNIPDNSNKTTEYTFCNGYKYNMNKKRIYFDCGKEIFIQSIKNNKLTIESNGKEVSFFKNAEDSKNHEFKLYFDLTKEEYINKKKQALEIIKIDKEKIYNVLNDNEYSKVIFIGNRCETIECLLVYDLVEKWISFSKNIYYIDSNDISKKFIEKLNKNNSSFIVDLNEYNDLYPTIYVISSNKVIDKYKIKCNGFNCSMYYNK